MLARAPPATSSGAPSPAKRRRSTASPASVGHAPGSAAPTSDESERKRKRDLAADMAEKRIREQATRGMGRSMDEPQIIEDYPVESLPATPRWRQLSGAHTAGPIDLD